MWSYHYIKVTRALCNLLDSHGIIILNIKSWLLERKSTWSIYTHVGYSYDVDIHTSFSSENCLHIMIYIELQYCVFITLFHLELVQIRNQT